MKSNMKKMGGLYKQLGKQIADARSNPNSIKIIEEMTGLANKLKMMKPDTINDMPAADQAKATEDFQKSFDEVIAGLSRVGDALKANDNTKAADEAKKIVGLRNQAHKKFKKDKD